MYRSLRISRRPFFVRGYHRNIKRLGRWRAHSPVYHAGHFILFTELAAFTSATFQEFAAHPDVRRTCSEFELLRSASITVERTDTKDHASRLIDQEKIPISAESREEEKLFETVVNFCGEINLDNDCCSSKVWFDERKRGPRLISLALRDLAEE